MDSTRLVRVGGCLLAGSLLVSLVLPTVAGPGPVLLFALLGWGIQASLVLGAVALVVGLVLRELGLLPRTDPADLEPVIDHYG